MKTPKRKTTYVDVDDVCVLAYPTYKEMENTRWKRKNRIKQLKSTIAKKEEALRKIYAFASEQTPSLNELSRQELAELLYTLITESIQVYEKLDHQISELECLDESMDINAYLKALPRQIRTLRKKLKQIDKKDQGNG